MYFTACFTLKLPLVAFISGSIVRRYLYWVCVFPVVCDYMGERLASLFGITTPKYQYAIDEYYRMKKEVGHMNTHTHILECHMSISCVHRNRATPFKAVYAEAGATVNNKQYCVWHVLCSPAGGRGRGGEPSGWHGGTSLCGAAESWAGWSSSCNCGAARSARSFLCKYQLWPRTWVSSQHSGHQQSPFSTPLLKTDTRRQTTNIHTFQSVGKTLVYLAV